MCVLRVYVSVEGGSRVVDVVVDAVEIAIEVGDAGMNLIDFVGVVANCIKSRHQTAWVRPRGGWEGRL
jgi:hypothetical protein